MRSWSKQSVEVTLTVREAERLLEWLDITCLDRAKDRSGFQLAYVLRNSVASNQPPQPED